MRLMHPLALGLLAAGCGAPDPAPDTPGVDLPETPCGRGVVVASSDYVSTTISLLDPRGVVVSERLVTSGTGKPGLNAALSGDVWLPTARTASREVVLLDRYATSVLTFVEPKSGAVRAQLSVGTGFKSNPYDYVEVGPGKAYVSRYETNPVPGKQAFDEGGDLLIVDPGVPAIIGRLAMPGGEVPPRPARMVPLGGLVWVALERLSADFQTAAAGRVVGVDPATDAVAWTRDLPGLASCGGLRASPSGERVVVSCTGLFADGDKQGEKAGLVWLAPSPSGPPSVVRTIQIPSTIGSPTWSLSFRSERSVWGTTFGHADASRPDRVFEVDLETGEVALRFTATSPFTLGDVLCQAACDGACFVADASAPGLLRFDVGASGPTVLPVDRTTGLPPRYLTPF